jgi:hypothetical protein
MCVWVLVCWCAGDPVFSVCVGVVGQVVDDFVQLAPRALPQLRPEELPVAFRRNGIGQQITASQHAQARMGPAVPLLSL